MCVIWNVLKKQMVEHCVNVQSKTVWRCVSVLVLTCVGVQGKCPGGIPKLMAVVTSEESRHGVDRISLTARRRTSACCSIHCEIE